ncbi:MAG: aminoglycoside phosphotransferase, partial [Sphingomonadales bacterium]|nr:aminoglycoside phosphotransferase [Sphingomonadales bacterium]
EADPDIMAARVTKRTHNASDADAEVVKMQLHYDLGDITWNRIDSSGSREDADAAVNALLGLDD